MAALNGLPPALLIILDGWGERGPFPDNAIAHAPPVNLIALRERFPSTQLFTHGPKVGLPDGVMGNSEVGHMNIGAGRVVYQDLPRINRALADGSLARHPELRKLFAAIGKRGGRLQLMGLVSDGGVHSHQAHLHALIGYAREAGLPVFVHAFSDGRDTGPFSGAKFIAALDDRCRRTGATLATLVGRYFAMDRDRRWERVQKAYRLLTEGVGRRAPFDFEHGADAVSAMTAEYDREVSDEFIQPQLIAENGLIRDGDGILFFNYRADRARQLSEAFTAPGFTGFARNRLDLAGFLTMTRYKEDYPHPVLFPPERPEGTIGEWLAARGGAQLRLAETEKYAHVTYFFSGGREESFAREERIMIPSPQVATYDLRPEMSAPEVTARALAAIAAGKFDLIVLNYANADMVGHTGRFEPAKVACRTVDEGVGLLLAAHRRRGGIAIISADHGNAEEMHAEDGTYHTQHTRNPVPCIVVADGLPGGNPLPPLRREGALCDIVPTLLALWGVKPPREMTGVSLFER